MIEHVEFTLPSYAIPPPPPKKKKKKKKKCTQQKCHQNATTFPNPLNHFLKTRYFTPNKAKQCTFVVVVVVVFPTEIAQYRTMTLEFPGTAASIQVKLHSWKHTVQIPLAAFPLGGQYTIIPIASTKRQELGAYVH